MAQIENNGKQTRIRQAYRPKEGRASPRFFTFFAFPKGRVPEHELTVLCEEVEQIVERYNYPRSKIVLTAIKIELWDRDRVRGILSRRRVIEV